MIPKCRECENTEFQDMNGRPNRWYCKHPEVRAHVSCPADTLICKTRIEVKKMTETKQGKATDRKATEAVNTIRIYCKNNDIHDCVFNCAIRQVCRGYFRNLNVPMLWPEVEVPDD